MPRISHSFCLITRITLGGDWKLVSCSLCIFLHSPVPPALPLFSHRYHPEPPSSELTDLKEGCEEDLKSVKASTAGLALSYLWTRLFGVLCHVRNRKQDRYFCILIDLTLCSRFKWW